MSLIHALADYFRRKDAEMMDVVVRYCEVFKVSRFVLANGCFWICITSLTADFINSNWLVSFRSLTEFNATFNYATLGWYVPLVAIMIAAIGNHQHAHKSGQEKRGASSPLEYGVLMRTVVGLLSAAIIAPALVVLLLGNVSGLFGVISGFAFWLGIYAASYNPGNTLKAWFPDR